MTKLIWDTKPHPYEQGLDRGVFYPLVGPGVVWSGLTRVVEAPDGTDNNGIYYEGRRVRSRGGRESFAGTIEAITYPDGLYEDILGQERANVFGMTYRVQDADRYRLHLVYNVLLEPSTSSYVQDDLAPFSWKFTTKPIRVPFGGPLAGGATGYSAHLIIDSGVAYPWTVAALEDILYGTDDTDPRLPLPDELNTVIDTNAILIITDYGDGSWSAEGPDEVVDFVDGTSFFIDWPSANMVSSDTYTVYTL